MLSAMTVTVRPLRVVVALLASAVIGATALVGCDDDKTTAPTPSPTSASDPTTVSGAPTLTMRPARLETRLVRLAGHLPRERRRSVVASIARPVRSWLRAGFVGGDYPRRDFPGAFADYTRDAARLASRQDEVTTNAALGADLVDVVPTRRTVRLSVFAPHGRAAGATADVTLVLLGIRADESEVELAVTGQLYLTRDGGWQVFGFDLARTLGAPGSYERRRR